MKNRPTFTSLAAIISLTVILCLSGCTKREPSDLAAMSLIPKPATLYSSTEWFVIKRNTAIYCDTSALEVKAVAEYLAGRMKPATGFELPVRQIRKKSPAHSITLVVVPEFPRSEKAAYSMVITKKGVTITASGPEGLFTGIQTLMQLLPPDIEKKTKQETEWLVPAGTITDYPEYGYRGAMLDVSRHFFGVEDVKRYIDLISYYKMNVLHLHLSDDQGWRIEIKSWPNLAEHGGSTQVGGGKGGYYTQEQYSDIVAYAKARYITIIPEIDMPGHTNAALASYPELNCNDKATELYTGTNVGFSSLCTRKEITYKFIDDVIRELAALTPGEYIHIGGDESHSTKKDDYIYFVNRVQDIVASHGKKVMGWDDICISDIRPNTLVQHWARVKNAVQAVEKGAKVVVSPATRAYLDMKYDSTSVYGLRWAGYVDVDSAYSWDPSKFIKGVGRENIEGVEAPLWSETVSKIDEVEYMAFPRLPGIAEIGWTPPADRKWENYRIRLAAHALRFDALGIDYFRSKVVPWKE